MAPVKKELANLGKTYIAEWRESKGLTQEQLAEGINMSRSSLSKIETSDAPYTQRTLEAIARVLECKPHELLLPVTDKESRTPEAMLRSALIAFGLDRADLDPVFSTVNGFIRARAVARPQSDQPHDQSEPSNLRREPTP